MCKFYPGVIAIMLAIVLSPCAFADSREDMKNLVGWYRTMPWPMDVEKEYDTDRDACLDMMLERTLSDRFKKEFTINPELQASIKRAEHFYNYITFLALHVIPHSIPTREEIEAYYE